MLKYNKTHSKHEYEQMHIQNLDSKRPSYLTSIIKTVI